MNPDADVTYQKVNLFTSDKCFIVFISDVPHYIWWNYLDTVYTILVLRQIHSIHVEQW